jgi:ribA/ribD-fused uncharacterized protein
MKNSPFHGIHLARDAGRASAARSKHAYGGSVKSRGGYKSYTFVISNGGPLSPRHRFEFIVDDVAYGSIDQYMTNQYKGFTDLVTNPDDAALLWSAKRESIMLHGCRAKFSQHAGMREALLNTGNAFLVYSDASDLIWSSGLDKVDARIWNISAWPGKNLLGFALMYMRASFFARAEDPALSTLSIWLPVNMGCVVNETC